MRADRKSLLLGTALASTLLLGSLLISAPASAQVTDCADPGPDRVEFGDTAPITCINTEFRDGDVPPADDAIYLTTNTNPDSYIYVNNSGLLEGPVDGIDVRTETAGSYIDILNSGTIFVGEDGIAARVAAIDSPILIDNSGEITAGGRGIHAYAEAEGSPVTILNSGSIEAGEDGISVETLGVDSSILIENSAAIDSGYVGIDTYSLRDNSGIIIRNSGAITSVRDGIEADTYGSQSGILIENSGFIDTAANGLNADTGYNGGDDNDIIIRNRGAIIAGEDGIEAGTYGARSSILIENDAAVRAGYNGITARSTSDDSDIAILNRGSINADRYGIDVDSSGSDSDIAISNSASIDAEKYGILAYAFGPDSDVEIANFGDISAVDGGIRALAWYGDIAILNSGAIDSTVGIIASTYGPDGLIEILNAGQITAGTIGIRAYSFGTDSVIAIVNSGTIEVTAGNYDTATGISARATGDDSVIAIQNSGDITATAGNGYGASAFGIRASAAYSTDSAIAIVNSGNIAVSASGTDPSNFVVALYASSYADNSPINITSTGKLTASGPYSYGILARTGDTGSDIAIVNAGDIDPNVGIAAWTFGPDSSVTVTNHGSVHGERSGIWALSYDGDVTIVNTGEISASSYQAIEIHRGDATILNSGLITGYVFTYDGDDTFINQPGGTFETKLTSDFGPGTNLFRNEAGGTVLAATNSSVTEISGLANLNRFENRGLISMVDGREGDVFFITGQIGQEIDFVASGRSTLAIDAFLGGPGSQADIFQINGNVSGQTALVVNNTNSGAGAAGAVIPVVEIEGNVKPDAFYLPQPIDTGFFEYDLFFRETNSGVFELRSFVGAGSFVLPQLLTGAQDIWHATSSTWFDRTADLRVLLAGGGSPIAYDPTAGYAGAPSAFTPAVWARGGGNWLDRQGSETVNAFGNNYRYKLDRDLEILDFQMGLDLGKRDFLSQGDILVFGVLGGFVNADLDYDQLVRRFDFEGGQVGGYATYLRGGLFVDTLLNVHLLDLETATLGFPSSLDATTVGLRTDTGYRFGSFNGGAFIEPLATLAVLWSDIDGFARGGNRVSFDDEANVRGRLGLRVGTSYPAWTGTTVEPFVIGSLWGNLSGDNQATLVSNGTSYRFEDDLDDVWGEVSAGVNFFNPSAATAVFAKVDVTFGNDVDGIGGKAGMRVAW